MAAGGAPLRKGWFYNRPNSRLEARYNNTAFIRGTASAVTFPLAATFSSTVASGALSVTGAITATTSIAATTTMTAGTGLTVTTGGISASGDNNLGGTAVTGARNTLKYGAAGTVVTAVGYGLHMPAITYTDAGVTGTIGVLATTNIGAPTVVATNTITYTDAATLVVADPVASTGATFTRKYGIWSAGQIRTNTNIQVNNTAAFASTQPVGAIVFNSSGATAPAGAIITGGGFFTDGTVMKKIIADGTVSTVG